MSIFYRYLTCAAKPLFIASMQLAHCCKLLGNERGNERAKRKREREVKKTVARERERSNQRTKFRDSNRISEIAARYTMHMMREKKNAREKKSIKKSGKNVLDRFADHSINLWLNIFRK